MKAALLALTDRGLLTARRIEERLSSTLSPTFFIHEKAVKGDSRQRGEGIEGTNWDNSHSFKRLSDIVPNLWREYSLLIFIMAAGIVVRQIASLIEGKDRDPAILVLDEEGKFVIPLLSGHLGGANFWSREIARQTGAQAVITTATDGRGLTAPDEYARRKGWKVEPINHLPTVNRLLLEQGFLNVWSRYPLNPKDHWLKDSHYRFLAENEKAKAQVILDTFLPNRIQKDCLYLIPPVLSIGVGCRRGISSETILARIKEAVKQIGASLKAISGIYSIDLKADEAGLIEAAQQLGVPFQTFPAAKLQAVNEQQQLKQSTFVKEQIGVDGVCEAASLLGSRQGRLILPKTIGQGVTVAISMENSLSSASGRETPTI